MSENTKPPPLVGSSRIQMLAVSFGSTDGKVTGVANRFDRARLEARIRYEERKAESHRRDRLFDGGSPDGSFERLPASKREAAFAKERRVHADMHAASRDAMRHPAILRSQMATFLQPFNRED